MPGLVRLVIHENPESHPDEAEGAYDDEGHLPASAYTLVLEELGEERNGGRSHEGADGCACVEDRSREGTVFLREVFGCGLDGGREVAGLAEGQYAAGCDEKPYADAGNRQGSGGTGLDGCHFLDGRISFDVHCGPAAGGVEAGACRPYAYSPEIALLGAHPVHEFARKEHAYRIDDGEDSRDGTVVVVVPVEFRRYEILPGEREYLPVHIVHRCGDEKQHYHPPAPIGHQFLLCGHIACFCFNVYLQLSMLCVCRVSVPALRGRER